VYLDLGISGLAVASATCFTNPIDVCKTRLQLQAQVQGQKPLGIVSMSTSILRNEGMSALTKGLAPSVARGLLYGGLRLGLYAPTKRTLVALQSSVPQQQRQAEQGLGLKIIAGSMSGCLAAAITNPTELLKTRLQAPNLKPEHTTTLGVLRAVVAADGVQGLWRGAIPGMARAATLTASQCATYDEAKRAIVAYTGLGDRSLLAQLASSMLTGLVTTTVANPMDVVKTIMFTSNKGPPAAQEQRLAAAATAPAGGGAHTGGDARASLPSKPAATGPLGVAADLLKREGPTGFLKGWSANYARLGPQTLITFIVSEKLRELAGMPSL